MPLTPEHRLVRRSRPLLWVYFSLLVMLCFVVARQFGWFPTGRAAPEPPQVATNEPRAVFGTPPPAKAPVNVPSPAPLPARAQPETSTRNRTLSSKEVPPGIHDLLRRWEDTVRSGDPEGQASLYGPTAEVYFTKRNVPHREIVSDKRHFLESYPKMNRYTVSNVKLESLNGDRAVISLIKDWDAEGAKRFAGSEKELLTLAWMNGAWKIVGEKELRVFWRKKD